jgi:predicted RNA-binding Zn-ribbon protein involved in translation (DUF1610 family)
MLISIPSFCTKCGTEMDEQGPVYYCPECEELYDDCCKVVVAVEWR